VKQNKKHISSEHERKMRRKQDARVIPM